MLTLLADGLSNRQIADRLVISEKTAIRHVSNIYGKLGVGTRAHAVGIAVARGLTAAPDQAGSPGAGEETGTRE